MKEMDTIQLCAQALCLEEMLSISIPEGFIYYFKTRKRLKVELTPTLRNRTEEIAQKVRKMLESGKTPPPEYSKKCDSCSLYDECQPKITGKKQRVKNYIEKMILQGSSSSPLGEL